VETSLADSRGKLDVEEAKIAELRNKLQPLSGVASDREILKILIGMQSIPPRRAPSDGVCRARSCEPIRSSVGRRSLQGRDRCDCKHVPAVAFASS
jgi:hypothetical protein